MPGVYKLMIRVFILFLYNDFRWKCAILLRFCFHFFGHRLVNGRIRISIDELPAGPVTARVLINYQVRFYRPRYSACS
jgi:hypothetical protein